MTTTTAARWIGWCGMAVAYVIALAGYPVTARHASDPGTSFRCPPPLVSAWARNPAFEKDRSFGLATDTDEDVDVNCHGPSHARLVSALLIAVLGAGALTTSGRLRRSSAREADLTDRAAAGQALRPRNVEGYRLMGRQ